MTKKIFTIFTIIAIVLSALPQQGLCLRPMASEISSDRPSWYSRFWRSIKSHWTIKGRQAQEEQLEQADMATLEPFSMANLTTDEQARITEILQRCFTTLGEAFTPAQLAEFKAKTDEIEVIKRHGCCLGWTTKDEESRSIALWIHNNREGLWSPSSLVDYFYKKGIYEEYISDIMLLLFHRHLNGKEIELDEAIEQFNQILEKLVLDKTGHPRSRKHYERKGRSENAQHRSFKPLEEPSIYAQRDDETKQFFRFLWVRTFNHPVSVRLEIDNATGSGILYFNMTSGAGGYELGNLMVSFKRDIAKEDVDRFLQLLEEENFWQLPTDIDHGGLDGDTWIVEGLQSGSYHFADRWSPEGGSIRKIGIFLLKLSGLKIKEGIEVDFKEEDLYRLMSNPDVEATKGQVSLTISADRQRYNIGDDIKIKYSLRNNSSKALTILRWGGEYAVNRILLYDCWENPVDSVKTAMIELQFKPNKDDFVTLKPGESIDFDFTGKIRKGTLKHLGRRRPYRGIFIDFGDSVYLLKEADTYYLQGMYRIEKEWLEAAKDLSIDAVWLGDIPSNMFTIEIREQKDNRTPSPITEPLNTDSEVSKVVTTCA